MRLIRPYRRAFFILQALCMLGLPFITIKGESALRFDIPTLRLYFFGHILFIEEFFLLLLGLLALVFLFVFFTAVLGRVWCGWFCPQSALLELQSIMASWFAGIGLSARWMDYIFQAIAFIMSALVSASLIWYLVPPAHMLELLEAGSNLPGGNIVRGFWIGQAVLIYLVTGFFGRGFCRTVCPYAKLQGVLFDKSTLVIEFDQNRRQECMGCDKCVQVCPTGIDIKDGLQVECVACAECVDACRMMTRQRGISPLVDYSFGEGRVVRPLVFISGLAFILFLGLLLVLVWQSSHFDITVSRTPGPLYTLTRDGDVINSYRVSINNRTPDSMRFRVSAEGPEGLRMAGPANVDTRAGDRKILHVAIVAATGRMPGKTVAELLFTDESGRVFRNKVTFFAP